MALRSNPLRFSTIKVARVLPAEGQVAPEGEAPVAGIEGPTPEAPPVETAEPAKPEVAPVQAAPQAPTLPDQSLPS